MAARQNTFQGKGRQLWTFCVAIDADADGTGRTTVSMRDCRLLQRVSLLCCCQLGNCDAACRPGEHERKRQEKTLVFYAAEGDALMWAVACDTVNPFAGDSDAAADQCIAWIWSASNGGLALL